MNKLKLLYATEMWEKFNFYGMRTLFSLFAVYYLGYSQQESVLFYGAYLALCYISPIFGGLLGDKVIGHKKAVLIGAVLLCFAQFTLFISASIRNIEIARSLTLIALGLVVCGNGFFKPNITSNLMACVDEPRLVDAVFTRYYFFLNCGVLLGTIIIPLIGDKTVAGGRDIGAFKYGFLTASLAMAIGIFFYVINQHRIPDAPRQPWKINIHLRNFTKSAFIFCGAGALFMSFANHANFIEAYLYPLIYALAFGVGAYILLEPSLTSIQRKDIISIIVSGALITCFWASMEQSGSSLTFLANNQVDRQIVGVEIPPAMFQMFTPLFVLVITLLTSELWQNLAQRNQDLSNFTKASIGLLMVSISFVIMAVVSKNYFNTNFPAKWLILLYFISAIGKSMVSPIMFALVGKKSPPQCRSVIYGLFYISNASGYALSGTLAKLLPPSIKDYKMAENLGVNLGDVLKNPNPQVVELLKKYHINCEYQQIWGYKITNFFEFFMIFGVLCGLCAVCMYSLNIFFKTEDKSIKDGI